MTWEAYLVHATIGTLIFLVLSSMYDEFPHPRDCACEACVRQRR